MSPRQLGKDIRVAAARPKALPMADGQTIGKLPLAVATHAVMPVNHSAPEYDCGAKEITMAKLNVGDKAPDFSLPDQNNRMVSLSDFEGQKLLLYFYPKAETPGCTRQAISIRNAAEDLHSAGVAFVGISPDTPKEQKAFDEKHNLGFPLLSDPGHEVAEAYGAWGTKSVEGRMKEGIIRSSFLIDEDGTIIQATYNIKPEETVPKAQEALA
jgi:peroxiredoxin Q/BCP